MLSIGILNAKYPPTMGKLKIREIHNGYGMREKDYLPLCRNWVPEFSAYKYLIRIFGLTEGQAMILYVLDCRAIKGQQLPPDMFNLDFVLGDDLCALFKKHHSLFNNTENENESQPS